MGTLAEIAAALPDLIEIHASCSAPVNADEILQNFGFAMPGATRTTAAKVAELRAALKAIADGRQPPS